MVFKDRAACCFCDFVLPSFYFSPAPLSTSGAAFFISNPLPCQATVAAPFHRFVSSGFNTALPRFVSSCRGGAEPTSLPLPLSTRFVDSFFRPSTASSPVRLLRFERLRLLPPPLPESTSLADFLFRLSLLSSGSSAATAASPSRPRGCGFYHRRFQSQPRTHDSVFLLSIRPGGTHRHCGFVFPNSSGARLLRHSTPSVRRHAAPVRQPVGRGELMSNALLRSRQIPVRDGGSRGATQRRVSLGITLQDRFPLPTKKIFAASDSTSPTRTGSSRS